MRKVLSFVLVLSLVLGSFGMAFAAPLSDVAGEKCEDAVNVLTQLGVVSGYPDGTYKPDQVVTRAEMAVIIVRALGLADYATGTSSFSDMGGHWSNPYVAYATSLGIIAGYPDGTFRPDKTVSYDEAATMLVAALGYTPESLTGTWPANYVTKAKTLGILDGIKAGSAGAVRGDIAIMTFQTLGLDIGYTNKDGEWKANGTEDKPDTMLIRLGAELYGEGEAFVVLGTEASVINLKPFLGAYVTAYQNSDEEIIAIKEVKSVFLTGTLDGEDGEDFYIGDDLTFTADGVEYTFDFIEEDYATNPGYKKFVNGEAGVDLGTFNNEIDYVLAVKVSGKKIKDVYSVAKWEPDAHFRFASGDLEDDNFYGVSFALDDNDEIDMDSFELLGVDSLDDIEKDNVVYIYAKDFNGTDEAISRIEVGTEVVTGTITKISSGKYTVNGVAYEASAVNSSVFSGLKLKDEVTFYLDYAGNVYHAKKVSSEGGNYAILLKTENASESLSANNDALVKLFLADGTTKVFSVDSELKNDLIDEGVWKNEDGTEPGTVVEYGLNKDGVIDYLVAVDINGPGEEKELTAKLTYNGVPVASDAVLFSYTGEDNEEDKSDKANYSVTTVAKAKGSKFSAEYYKEDNKILVMLIEGEAVSTDKVYGVVTGWAEDSSSSTDRVVTMLVDGVSKTYDVKKTLYTTLETFETTDKAELYEVKFDAAGVVKELIKITDSIEDEITVLVPTGEDPVYENGAYGDITIDSEAVAYILKVGKSTYETARITKANLGNADVRLFDVDGDDVADIVLIDKNVEENVGV